jgi:uncharacterized cupredoxin-like copper-binding protein
VLVLGLSSGHKVGLALAAAGFAGFSLIVSMLVPRWRPQFPGRGLPLFLVVCVLLFVGMLAAVFVFGKESEEHAEAAAPTGQTTEPATTTAPAKSVKIVQVSEVDFKIELPKTALAAGSYEFDVSNDGKAPHDLTIKGPVNKATPEIDPGGEAKLTVDLKPGTYDFYCAVPGHRQLGMEQKVTVS